MVSVPTVFGILTTVSIGLILRNVLPLRSLIITGEQAFVVFMTYGLAFALISSASTVIRRRDTIILILAATIIWGIFVEKGNSLGMVRYLTFAALMTVGVALGRSMAADQRPFVRISMGAVIPAVLCGIGGLVYYVIIGWLGRAAVDLGSTWTFGLSWGLSLGLAVGLGVAVGCEIVGSMVRNAGRAGR